MKLLHKIAIAIFPSNKYKLNFEFFYWYIMYLIFKKFNNEHYKYLFTDIFGLDYEFYNQKVILDIGCGPRGSLEWAKNTKERIGLDPLIAKFKKFGIENHKARYIEGVAEEIPIHDNFFEVISSFNSFDHFDNINEALKEIYRVLKPNGLFLLISDVHDYPKLCEPSGFSFKIKDVFNSIFKILEWNEIKGSRMYKSIKRNHQRKMNSNRGIIVAKMWKRN